MFDADSRSTMFIAAALLSFTAVAVVLAWFAADRIPADNSSQVARAWLASVVALDSDRVADLTCDDEIWLANAVAGSSLATDIMSSSVLTNPRLRSLIDSAKNSVRIDDSQLQFTSASQSDGVDSVRVKGRLRLRVRNDWFTYPVDEEWQVIRESGGWRWCGMK